MSAVQMRLLVLFALLHLADGEILTVSATKMAAVTGSKVAIGCMTDAVGSSINWDFFRTETHETVLYFNNELQTTDSRISVSWDSVTSKSELIINNVSVHEAGHYRCYESRDSRNRADIDLTIISAVQFCDTNTFKEGGGDGYAVDASCLAFYRGPARPSIDCQPPGDEVISRETGKLVAQRHVYTTDSSVSCRLFFSTAAIGGNDVPSFVYHWTKNVSSTAEPGAVTSNSGTVGVESVTQLPESSLWLQDWFIRIILASVLFISFVVNIILCVCCRQKSKGDVGSTHRVMNGDVTYDYQDVSERRSQTNEPEATEMPHFALTVTDSSEQYEEIPPAAVTVTSWSTDSSTPGRPMHAPVPQQPKPIIANLRDHEAAIQPNQPYQAFDVRTLAAPTPPSVYSRLTRGPQQSAM